MKVLLEKKVSDAIKDSLGKLPPESGGILGGKENRITSFYYDSKGKTEKNSYYPDVCSINTVLEKWDEQGIQFLGFVHSHQFADCVLSKRDLAFARRILSENPEISCLYFPVVSSIYDYGYFKMIVYAISSDSVLRVDYEVTEKICVEMDNLERKKSTGRTRITGA